MSSDENNAEFVIHVKDEHDYHFPNKYVELRNELFENIKAAFFMRMKKNLEIYEVESSLKKYITEKSHVKKGIKKIPPTQFIDRKEDRYDENPAGVLLTETLKKHSPEDGKPTFVREGLDPDVTLSDFEQKAVIGLGSHGKIYLV